MLTHCLNNAVDVYGPVWTFFAVGTYDKIYIWARRDEWFLEEGRICISVDLENHTNPQNANNENKSFYAVSFNRRGYFVGQERQPTCYLHVVILWQMLWLPFYKQAHISTHCTGDSGSYTGPMTGNVEHLPWAWICVCSLDSSQSTQHRVDVNKG